MMISASASVLIYRPIDEVFDFSTAFENNQLWQQDVIRSEITSDGPVGVGTTGIAAQKFMGREIENELEVTAYEPPYQQCIATTSGPISFSGCSTYEEQDGGTRVTISMEGEAGGFFKVAEGLVQKQLASTVQRDLNNLKAVMEG